VVLWVFVEQKDNVVANAGLACDCRSFLIRSSFTNFSMLCRTHLLLQDVVHTDGVIDCDVIQPEG
jgi:hypothetical protein